MPTLGPGGLGAQIEVEGVAGLLAHAQVGHDQARAVLLHLEKPVGEAGQTLQLRVVRVLGGQVSATRMRHKANGPTAIHERVKTFVQALTIEGQEIKKDEPIGIDPKTGMPIFVLVGRFGPYVQLGIERAILVGLSWGGMVAMRLASTTAARVRRALAEHGLAHLAPPPFAKSTSGKISA